MAELTVDLIVARQLLRIAVTPVSLGDTPRWKAQLMHRCDDGAFYLSETARSVTCSAAPEAIGSLVAILTGGMLTEAATGLRSSAVLDRPPVVTLPPKTIAPVSEGRITDAEIIEVMPAPDLVEIPEAVGIPETTPPTAFPSAEDRPAAMSAAIDAAVGRLAEQLAGGHTQGFLDYLAFTSRFHAYSAGNVMLIMLQKPDATRVAGMGRWNTLGYRVRKGERALFVWCPILRKVRDADTGLVGEELVGFRPGPVFDASQLDGLDERPLPSPFPEQPDDVEGLYHDLAGKIRAAGISVEEKPLPSGTQGVSQGGEITINTGMGSRQRVAVLLHELAHELGHHGPDQAQHTREQKELEAEAVAFVVAAVLGLEIPSSADYVLNWHGSPEQLKASLGVIQRLTKACLAIAKPTSSAAEGVFSAA